MSRGFVKGITQSKQEYRPRFRPRESKQFNPPLGATPMLLGIVREQQLDEVRGNMKVGCL